MQPLRINELSIKLSCGESLVRGITFQTLPEEILASMGPSDSAKSSILACLTGTASPHLSSNCDVGLGGKQITFLPVEKRRLGLMLQQDYLFTHMNVRDNLLSGLRDGTRTESMVLRDEPFSRLDVAMREQISRFQGRSAANLPVLLVAHDVPEGGRFLDIGSSLKNGLPDA